MVKFSICTPYNFTMKIRPALLASAVVLSMSPAHALPSQEWAARFFIDMYARTCVKNVGRPDLILKEMKTRKAHQLTPDKARSYLQGFPGKVWSIKNVMGEFLVSLRDGGDCAIHINSLSARTANVQTQFRNLIENDPPVGVNVTKLEERHLDSGSLHMITYAWAINDSIQRILFSLRVFQEAGKPMAGIVSAALVE